MENYRKTTENFIRETEQPQEGEISQCEQVIRRFENTVADLKSTVEQMAKKLYPLTGDICSPLMNESKAPGKPLVPFVALLDEHISALRDIEHRINFILNHVEL